LTVVDIERSRAGANVASVLVPFERMYPPPVAPVACGEEL